MSTKLHTGSRSSRMLTNDDVAKHADVGSCSLRGFLVIFDLAQILNLVWTSFKTR